MINFPEPGTDLWTNPPEPAAAAEDPRIIAALEEYLAELESGARPERLEFLQKHAAIADALETYLDGLHLMHSTATSLCPDGEAGVAPPTRSEEAQNDEARPTTPVGDFRILREIGRGGMGIVYEAVQLSLGRRVALKVLPFVSALDPKHLQRFSNEAKAAAHLHHPAIVPVYAVGCERGVHYYAMHYVEGQSLAALIQGLGRGEQSDDRAATLAGEPAAAVGGEPDVALNDPAAQTDARTLASLATITLERSFRRTAFCRRVAQLGRVAAEALEHAHQMGIVHRDIKPANLLLDGHGRLWITDFGLALMQNDGGLTLTGELLGTLRYMSPEQAMGKRGAVDHRADIYSLGATLYELLTLKPLFQGQDRHELLQRIATEEPRPPRKLDPAVPEELETILLKALAKSPAERYHTAQEFADDLQRFMEDRPILARRPTPLERATKWARRHRAVVVSALALLIGSVAVLLASTLIIARAYKRERENADEARLQHARAEGSFRQARQAVDLLAEISEEGLTESAQALRRRLLEAALGYYQDFIAQHQDEPSITAELAASQARVTRLLEELSALQGSGQFRALTDKAVQRDLGLSPPQLEKVTAAAKELGERWRKEFRSFRGLSAEDRWTRSLELARLEEKSISDLLTPQQVGRFHQIVLQLQQRGLGGYSDPDVVQALHLSKKQREKIRTIQQEAYLPPWEAPAEEGWKKGRKKFTDPWVAIQERVLEVFTPEQKAKWREMTGEPVAATVHLVPGVGFEPRPHFTGRPGAKPGPPMGFSPKRPR